MKHVVHTNLSMADTTGALADSWGMQVLQYDEQNQAGVGNSQSGALNRKCSVLHLFAAGSVKDSVF